MAGVLSSSQKGFSGSIHIRQPSTIYWNPNCQLDYAPQQVQWRPCVHDGEGREKIIYETRLQAAKTGERKPQPFFYQQDKILVFKPPVINDTYKLDTPRAVLAPSNGMHVTWTAPQATQYVQLRDENKIENSRPMQYSVPFASKIYTANRPSRDYAVSSWANTSGHSTGIQAQTTIVQNRNKALPKPWVNTSGHSTGIAVDNGQSKNRRANIIYPKQVDWKISKPTATITAAPNANAKKIQLKQNLLWARIRQPHSFPIY